MCNENAAIDHFIMYNKSFESPAQTFIAIHQMRDVLEDFLH